MTREEAIKHGKEQLEVFGGEHREFIDMAIKALEQPCEDTVSRQAVFEALNSINGTSELDKAFEVIEKLPSVTLIHTETVTEFADRCRECGTRYSRYKDFCEYVAKMVLKDDFEENAGANAEFLCRKLSKLGIVKADEDEWVLAEMESEE